jgi:uncharacterized protein (TIGR02265 family)
MVHVDTPHPAQLSAETVPLSERVVFLPTVQSLFSRLPAGALTPELTQAVRALGIDLDRPLLTAYPFAIWARVLEVTARTVYPKEAAQDAHRLLGQRLIEGYVETGIGRALFALLKLIGPRRTLQRTAKAFRNGNNYCEATVTEVSPTEFIVWMNEVGTVPTMIAGVLQAGLTQAGAISVAVRVVRVDSVGMTYRVTWK